MLWLLGVNNEDDDDDELASSLESLDEELLLCFFFRFIFFSFFAISTLPIGVVALAEVPLADCVSLPCCVVVEAAIARSTESVSLDDDVIDCLFSAMFKAESGFLNMS